MDWIVRLNAAMEYIEEHLTEKLDYEQLGRVACCSSYHFQRMFSYMADMPLSEYVRRRRMSLAAADLQDSGRKIVDVALKYGYDSPTAFNRAFQSVHGFAPSRAREPGAALKGFPPIGFQISIKGAVAMDYRIEKKDAFRIVGISVPLEKELEKNAATLPGVWARAAQDGTLQKLCGLMNGQPAGLLGVSACDTGAEEWRYYLAVASTLDRGSLEEYQIPAFTWAVFSGRGPNTSIVELERRVVTEWLPTSGYEYANGPDIEVYLNADPQDAQYQVWIPVVSKAE